jgi:hypothetical protein
MRLLPVILVLLAASHANAALLGRAPLTPGGSDYQAYYDDVLAITWLADANLAATQSFGAPTSFPDGRMTWYQAIGWIAAMNSASYLGISTWRLPSVTDKDESGCQFSYNGTDCGQNPDPLTSEFAHLYYVTLGNSAYYDTNSVLNECANIGGMDSPCFANRGPFVGGPWTTCCWSGSTYPADGGVAAWYFSFTDGGQSWAGKDYNGLTAWAVADGDALAPTVPIPAAAWLFASALGGLAWLRRSGVSA